MTEAKEGSKAVSDAMCKSEACMDLHKFCFTNCCALRCLMGILAVVLIFSAGYCAGGGHSRHGGHYRSGHERFEGRAMNHMYGYQDTEAIHFSRPASRTINREMMIYPSVAPAIPATQVVAPQSGTVQMTETVPL